MQFIHKQEFMWSVHNTRLLAYNPSLRCPMCGQFTINGHIAGYSPSMLGLQKDRYNDALHLLLSQLERYNGGRWETITADLGNKHIKSFASPITINTPLDYHSPPCLDTPTRLVAADEGTSPDSLTCCRAVLPGELLPHSLRPIAHKPDFIRLLEPMFIGHSNNIRRYSSIRNIRIGEWKYCTDTYISQTAQLIRDKHTRCPTLSVPTGQVPISISSPFS
jgi:hypothetical protein